MKMSGKPYGRNVSTKSKQRVDKKGQIVGMGLSVFFLEPLDFAQVFWCSLDELESILGDPHRTQS